MKPWASAIDGVGHGVGRDGDGRHLLQAGLVAQAVQQADAVRVGQLHVQQQEVGTLCVALRSALAPRGR